MIRLTIAIAVSAVLVAGHAMAQTTQTAPPPVTIPQTNPAQQNPTVPPPAPKPTPVPFPPEAKVAYIDLQVVVRDSKLGKIGQEAMKVLQDRLASQLAAKNKEIQALQDKMKSQQGVVSDAVLNGMAKELDKMGREAQFIQQDAQVQIDQKNAELLTEFQEKVLPLVEEVRQEKGLWIVFALGDNSNIAAAHAGLDLSQEIVKRLDAATK